MGKLAEYLRLKEWIDSKVTMMLGVSAFFLCRVKADISVCFKVLITYFLFLSMFLALSYVFNDYSDMDIDKKAGKKKAIFTLPKWLVYVSFVLMILIGDVPVLLVVKNRILCMILIIVITFLGLAYSFPGIRFKEKGVWGLIECSLAQRCLPLALILLFFDLNFIDVIIWTGWFVLSFVDGLRYILIHQYIDQESDRSTGTHTYVSDKKLNIRKSIIILCFLDVLGCAAILFTLFFDHPVIIAAGSVICILLELCVYQVLNVYAKKDWLVSFDSVPLEAFFNIIMPVMFGICLMTENLWMGIFPLFILLCSIRAIKAKSDIVSVFFKAKFSVGKKE